MGDDTGCQDVFELEGQATIGHISRDDTGRPVTPDDVTPAFTLEQVQEYVDAAIERVHAMVSGSANFAFIYDNHESYALLSRLAYDIELLKGRLPKLDGRR